MEKQQLPPVSSQFFIGETRTINPIWQRWFQKLKIREDETRRRPYKILTTDTTLTSWDLGKSVLFSVGATDTICRLPQITSRDLWAWVTIIRMGSGKLTITANSADRIEYSSEGGSCFCEEVRRKAANVTLQIVDLGQWAISAGLGIWSID